MKTIEIVSHLYGIELPHYVGAFKYHLSSLVLHPPRRCDVSITVCYCPADRLAVELLRWFGEHTGLRLDLLSYDDPLVLGRRCIGRNDAAKITRADIVWFADGDFVFHEGCLDALAALEWPSDAVLLFPRRYMIHREHATGDRISADPTPGLIEAVTDPAEWVETGHSVAIGGIQIASGDFCREHGYLDGQRKWMKPHVRPFADTLDDRAFRLYAEAKSGFRQRKIDLPGLYRIRQTVNARMKR